MMCTFCQLSKLRILTQHVKTMCFNNMQPMTNASKNVSIVLPSYMSGAMDANVLQCQATWNLQYSLPVFNCSQLIDQLCRVPTMAETAWGSVTERRTPERPSFVRTFREWTQRICRYPLKTPTMPVGARRFNDATAQSSLKELHGTKHRRSRSARRPRHAVAIHHNECGQLSFGQLHRKEAPWVCRCSHQEKSRCVRISSGASGEPAPCCECYNLAVR